MQNVCVMVCVCSVGKMRIIQRTRHKRKPKPQVQTSAWRGASACLGSGDSACMPLRMQRVAVSRGEKPEKRVCEGGEHGGGVEKKSGRGRWKAQRGRDAGAQAASAVRRQKMRQAGRTQGAGAAAVGSA